MSSSSFDFDGDFLHNSDVTWKKIKTARLKDGFVDGKYLGENSTIQDGFNNGYKVGFQSNFQVSVLEGIVGAIESNLKELNSNYLQDASELKKEIIKLRHLSIEVEKNKVSPNTSKLISDDIENELSNNHNDAIIDTVDQGKDTQDFAISSEKFFEVKKKTIALLERSGYSSLTDLICSI